ncbi:MAG: TadE family protein [Steroidobacteraceae bacterium]
MTAGAGRAVARQRGATLVEFHAVMLLAAVPIVMATLELGMLFSARHALDYATFEAARTGAVTQGARPRMLMALATALAPLLAPLSTGDSIGNPAAVVASARAAALAEVLNPVYTSLVVETPRTADFDAVGVRAVSGSREIPNDNLSYRVRARGSLKGTALADANMLAIRVTWCRRLHFPFIDGVLIAAMRSVAPQHELCYAARRVPITSRAVVQMQSAANERLIGE